jgi:hypothetical protein
METNFDSLGITSYYEKLPMGKKDDFIREVADAIGKSTPNVRLKIKTGNWQKTEIPVVLSLIQTK